MIKKEHSTNGYVTHKRVYISFLGLWFLCAVIAVVVRFYEILHMERNALSLFVLAILLLITGYMVYMIKSTKITFAIDDKGVTSRSARKGLLFHKTSRFAPWKSIVAISIGDNKKGPLIINTDDSEIISYIGMFSVQRKITSFTMRLIVE